MLDKLLSELGPRVSSIEYDVYQATVGLRGKVFAGWSYDAYLQVGANDQTETQSGNALTSRIEDLTFAPDGGKAICGGFNPFGSWVDLSRMRSVYRRRREQPCQCRSDDPRGLARADRSFSCRLASCARPSGCSTRRTNTATAPARRRARGLPDGREDILGFNAAADLEGEDDNTDVYVEASIPLLARSARRPFARGGRGLPIRGVRFGRRGRRVQGRASVSTGRNTANTQFVPACRTGAERVRAVSAAVSDVSLLCRRPLRGWTATSATDPTGHR